MDGLFFGWQVFGVTEIAKVSHEGVADFIVPEVGVDGVYFFAFAIDVHI